MCTVAQAAAAARFLRPFVSLGARGGQPALLNNAGALELLSHTSAAPTRYGIMLRPTTSASSSAAARFSHQCCSAAAPTTYPAPLAAVTALRHLRGAVGMSSLPAGGARTVATASPASHVAGAKGAAASGGGGDKGGGGEGEGGGGGGGDLQSAEGEFDEITDKVGRRCKLDPSLKAPWFQQKFTT